jgi:branched-chain amino acid aminotransferase
MWSTTWTFFDGAWHEGNPPILGPRSHAFWLGSSVFDGARYYDGVAPDLDLHFARVNRSAVAMHLKALVSVEEWTRLAWEGIAKFDKNAALYLRPMYWPEMGSNGVVAPDGDSTRWLLSIYEAPMPGEIGSATMGFCSDAPDPEVTPSGRASRVRASAAGTKPPPEPLPPSAVTVGATQPAAPGGRL